MLARTVSADSTASASATAQSTDSNTIDDTMGTEVAIRPKMPVPVGPMNYRQYQIDTKKEGDVDKEKFIENRIRQLGLLDSKRSMERSLAQQLDQQIEQDHLIGALKRIRRRRPLSERVHSVTDEITNVIRPSILKDPQGNKMYKVEILMGLFTKDIEHRVRDREVLITSCMPSGAKLTKEITIEFPNTVDITGLHVVFRAGVFRMTAPFKTNSPMSVAVANAIPEYNSLTSGENIETHASTQSIDSTGHLELDTSMDTVLEGSSPMTSPSSDLDIETGSVGSADFLLSQCPPGDVSEKTTLDESGYCEDSSEAPLTPESGVILDF